MGPRVSIITPTYNRAGFLEETIESVLAQTYPNIEYHVIDDGSTDNTIGILRKYENRLTWETQPNMGEQRTVNKGWRWARGEYILVVNSDDPVLPELVETAVNFLSTRPDVLVAYPDWYIIDEQSQRIREFRTWDYSYEEMVKFWACFVGPGALMRHTALDLEPERSTQYKYVSDFEYWLRLGLHGPFARIPQCLAMHRTHGESAGASQGIAIGHELLDLSNRYFRQPDLPAEVKSLRRTATGAAYLDAAERCLVADRRLLGLVYSVIALYFHPRRDGPKRLPSVKRIAMLHYHMWAREPYKRLQSRLPKRVRATLSPVKHWILSRRDQ